MYQKCMWRKPVFIYCSKKKLASFIHAVVRSFATCEQKKITRVIDERGWVCFVSFRSNFKVIFICIHNNIICVVCVMCMWYKKRSMWLSHITSHNIFSPKLFSVFSKEKNIQATTRYPSSIHFYDRRFYISYFYTFFPLWKSFLPLHVVLYM